MKIRPLNLIWLLLLIGATFAATQAHPEPSETWMIPILIFGWIITACALIPSPARTLLRSPLRAARSVPFLYWLLMLIVICAAISLWLVPYQPNNGHTMRTIEFVYVLWALWLIGFLLGYGWDAPSLRATASKLGKSKFTGVLITLTTLVIIFWAGEAYLRIFYITTDGYGFTAMNYWWYEDFYRKQLNSLGYRDHEPTPDDPANPVTRIAVVGDSFAAGHGISNIDDTFPQRLESKLGTGYDVDLVAQSGWDTDVELVNLQNYKYRPDVVILSYYLNDIDYLMQGDLSPDTNFMFPKDERVFWVIINFFLPNYLWYNVVQFTSPTRTTNFAYDLIGAYADESLWTPQKEALQQYVDWMKDENIRLIVLVWPNLGQVDASTPATQTISHFFIDQGVQVVDMTDALRSKSVGEITVNRFDTHPSIEANRIAADLLTQAVLDKEQSS